MITKDREGFYLTSSDEKFKGEFDRHSCSGPLSLSYNGKNLLNRCRCYSDGSADTSAVVRHSRGYHKSGIDIVEVEGYLPIGAETHFRHKYQFDDNHAVVANDITFHRGAEIERHFGVGSLFIPGDWQKFFIIPAAQHIVEGAVSGWQEIDRSKLSEEENRLMVGHWHRPPLSITFVDKDNSCFEVATGYDLWRWEKSLGYGPESGSYKLFLTEDGIEFVREPLMCCSTFTPEPVLHRFTWFMSWGESDYRATEIEPECWLNPIENNYGTEFESIGIDIDAIDWQNVSLQKKSDGTFTDKPCFCQRSVQKTIRGFCRKLSSNNSPKIVIVKGLTAGICYNGSHIGRKGETLHNDTTYILDLMHWLKNHFKESEVIFHREDSGVSLLEYKNT